MDVPVSGTGLVVVAPPVMAGGGDVVVAGAPCVIPIAGIGIIPGIESNIPPTPVPIGAPPLNPPAPIPTNEFIAEVAAPIIESIAGIAKVVVAGVIAPTGDAAGVEVVAGVAVVAAAAGGAAYTAAAAIRQHTKMVGIMAI